VVYLDALLIVLTNVKFSKKKNKRIAR